MNQNTVRLYVKCKLEKHGKTNIGSSKCFHFMMKFSDDNMYIIIVAFLLIAEVEKSFRE